MIAIFVAHRRFDPLVSLHCRDPGFPARADLGVGPVAVMLENPGETDDPGGEGDIDKGDQGAEEEGAGDMGGVDQGSYGGLKGVG
jgi:hypothetical protein